MYGRSAAGEECAYAPSSTLAGALARGMAAEAPAAPAAAGEYPAEGAPRATDAPAAPCGRPALPAQAEAGGEAGEGAARVLLAALVDSLVTDVALEVHRAAALGVGVCLAAPGQRRGGEPPAEQRKRKWGPLGCTERPARDVFGNALVLPTELIECPAWYVVWVTSGSGAHGAC